MTCFLFTAAWSGSFGILGVDIGCVLSGDVVYVRIWLNIVFIPLYSGTTLNRPHSKLDWVSFLPCFKRDLCVTCLRRVTQESLLCCLSIHPYTQSVCLLKPATLEFHRPRQSYLNLFLQGVEQRTKWSHVNKKGIIRKMFGLAVLVSFGLFTNIAKLLTLLAPTSIDLIKHYSALFCMNRNLEGG